MRWLAAGATGLVALIAVSSFSLPARFGGGGGHSSFAFALGTPGDSDGDGVGDLDDNCVIEPNPDQRNTDGDPIFGSPAASPPVANPPPDDITRPYGDGLGDACDGDDDNDFLFDDFEEDEIGVPSPPGGACAGTSGPLNPYEHDTDGDRVNDWAECQLGSDGVDAGSTPLTCAALGRPDSDGDRLCNQLESDLGSNPNDSDTDDDGINDGIEFRGYGTSLTQTDSDADGCNDSMEIASVDTNTIVNSLDLLIVALQFGLTDRPVHDIDKNGTVNSNDLLVVALQFNETCA